MYFVRDLNGGIVNVGRATRIWKDGRCHANFIVVRCTFDGSDEKVFDLFKGDATECGNYVDHLFARLAKHQEHDYVV